MNNQIVFPVLKLVIQFLKFHQINIKHLCHNLFIFLKNQQLELDLLLERVNEITKQADQRNRENIKSQSDKVTEEWTSLVSDLENRRDTLTGLAQVRYKQTYSCNILDRYI